MLHFSNHPVFFALSDVATLNKSAFICEEMHGSILAAPTAAVSILIFVFFSLVLMLPCQQEVAGVNS